MKSLNLKTKLLVGRFLTRSGDQAWDFAVPLTLLKIFPDQLRLAALYYFLVKLFGVIILPRLTSLIDRLNRFSAAKLGIFLQFGGVAAGAISIFGFFAFAQVGNNHGNWVFFALFICLVAGGLLASLGSAFVDIAIANDLVPTRIVENELAQFNSRLRQVDLSTEVGAPVLAGLILLIDQPMLLTGFLLIALWNIISFFPELYLLKSVFHERPDLVHKKLMTSEQTRKTLMQKLTQGWTSFFSNPSHLRRWLTPFYGFRY